MPNVRIRDATIQRLWWRPVEVVALQYLDAWGEAKGGHG